MLENPTAAEYGPALFSTRHNTRESVPAVFFLKDQSNYYKPGLDAIRPTIETELHSISGLENLSIEKEGGKLRIRFSLNGHQYNVTCDKYMYIQGSCVGPEGTETKIEKSFNIFVGQISSQRIMVVKDENERGLFHLDGF